MKRQEWSNWASGTCNLRNGCCTKADFLAWVAWIRVAHAVCRSLGPFPSDLSNFLSRPLREIINTKSPTSVRWCWRNNQQWRAWVWVPGKAGREREMHRGFDFLGYRGFCLLWYGTGCHLSFLILFTPYSLGLIWPSLKNPQVTKLIKYSAVSLDRIRRILVYTQSWPCHSWLPCSSQGILLRSWDCHFMLAPWHPPLFTVLEPSNQCQSQSCSPWARTES